MNVGRRKEMICPWPESNIRAALRSFAGGSWYQSSISFGVNHLCPSIVNGRTNTKTFLECQFVRWLFNRQELSHPVRYISPNWPSWFNWTLVFGTCTCENPRQVQSGIGKTRSFTCFWLKMHIRLAEGLAQQGWSKRFRRSVEHAWAGKVAKRWL